MNQFEDDRGLRINHFDDHGNDLLKKITRCVTHKAMDGMSRQLIKRVPNHPETRHAQLKLARGLSYGDGINIEIRTAMEPEEHFQRLCVRIGN